MAQMMAGLSKMLAPAMLGMAVGSMVGKLAQRAFGLHDLPIPRDQREIVLVGDTIDAFAGSWEIPIDEMRLWVLAHELCGHVLFSVPHIREPLADLVRRHVGAFRPDPEAVADKLAHVELSDDDPFQALQQAFGDPEVLLGAVRSPDQLALEPALDAAVATVVGYTDWVVDAVAVRVIGGDALRIAEAVRRRRVEISPDDLFVERLLGIRLGAEQVSRGKAFVQGVVDRGGEQRPRAAPRDAGVDADTQRGRRPRPLAGPHHRRLIGCRRAAAGSSPARSATPLRRRRRRRRAANRQPTTAGHARRPSS